MDPNRWCVVSDRNPTREAKRQSSEIRAAYVYAPDDKYSGCDREARDPAPSRQRLSKAEGISRAASQAIRRTQAAALGLCSVCCVLPRVHGTRCLGCHALRANEAQRTGRLIERESAAERRLRLRRDGLCQRCEVPSVRHDECLACRLWKAAGRAVLPVVSAGSQGRGERTARAKNATEGTP